MGGNRARHALHRNMAVFTVQKQVRKSSNS